MVNEHRSGGSDAGAAGRGHRGGERSTALGAQTGRDPRQPRREELEAAREAKYREIRDAELDYRTGKLSHEDYEAVNGALRAEALEILNRLETLESEQGRGDRRRGETYFQGFLSRMIVFNTNRIAKNDRPTVEVALDHRAAAERPLAAADPECAREAGILARVHQHKEDQHDRDEYLEEREDRFHPPSLAASTEMRATLRKVDDMIGAGAILRVRCATPVGQFGQVRGYASPICTVQPLCRYA